MSWTVLPTTHCHIPQELCLQLGDFVSCFSCIFTSSCTPRWMQGQVQRAELATVSCMEQLCKEPFHSFSGSSGRWARPFIVQSCLYLVTQWHKYIVPNGQLYLSLFCSYASVISPIDTHILLTTWFFWQDVSEKCIHPVLPCVSTGKWWDVTNFRFMWPCIINVGEERTNGWHK